MSITQAEAISAASDLVRALNGTPGIAPQMHSVFVKTEVGADKQFQYAIAVSEHPKAKGRLSVPAEHFGVPVIRVPWPKGL